MNNRIKSLECIASIAVPFVPPIGIFLLFLRRSLLNDIAITPKVTIFCFSILLYWTLMIMYGGVHINTILAANFAILISIMPLCSDKNVGSYIRFISSTIPVFYCALVYVSALSYTNAVEMNTECGMVTHFLFIYTFVHSIVFYNAINRVVMKPTIFEGLVTKNGNTKAGIDTENVIMIMIFTMPLLFLNSFIDDNIGKAFGHFLCIFK